ncbi:hypothetical protein, partial [Pseudomonas sp. PS02303]|uniref:hypothetical protein n=1 Tax=Pseudomonas sp. PS02303 TaxID=2991429 RepID=UPI00249B5089
YTAFVESTWVSFMKSPLESVIAVFNASYRSGKNLVRVTASGRSVPLKEGRVLLIAAIHGSHLLAKTCPFLGPEHEMDN